jgi:hypothetical protein
MDEEALVTPIHPLPILSDMKAFANDIDGLTFKDALKVLAKYVKERGEFIPPLINNYMQLSPSMKAFGTAKNEDFGDVEETGILVTIADIYPEKKHRHIDSYIPKSSLK